MEPLGWHGIEGFHTGTPPVSAKSGAGTPAGRASAWTGRKVIDHATTMLRPLSVRSMRTGRPYASERMPEVITSCVPP